MKDDELIIGQAEDKIGQCFERNMPTNTIFLDPHQQSLLRGTVARKDWGCELLFYGGYEDAERVVLLCLPDYATIETAQPLMVIRVSAGVGKGGRQLAHGDYLGSITGLGISRSMIGDILVRSDGADIIVLEEIADYILRNYTKAGRAELSVEACPIEDLMIPERKLTHVTDTVASLRLDNIVASAFGISRTKATQAIGQGLVFVNHVEATKVDMQLSEGDRIVLRHKGRADLSQVGGRSRKGRVYVEFERY